MGVFTAEDGEGSNVARFMRKTAAWPALTLSLAGLGLLSSASWNKQAFTDQGANAINLR